MNRQVDPLTVVPHHSPPLLAAPVGRPFEPEAQGRDIDVKGYINVLYDSRWLIGTITLLITAIAIVYALLATPVYQANLMIHVEEESPNASKNILSEVSSLFETKKAAIAEMELLRSRMVIANAVDNLQLFIDVRPKYFPVVGFWFANRHAQELSEPGIFGRGGYVWGPEKAEVSLFEVPTSAQNIEFTLTAQANGIFHLSGAPLDAVYEGRVGVTHRIPTRSGDIELKVDSLAAKPGAEFIVKRNSRLRTIENIQNAMLITEQGKQSGIIEVKLQGDDAQRINNLLSEIGREYMRQNLARKTEEAEKSLAFLNQQLPALKRQLEQSEERYNTFRNTNGTINMAEEARMSLQQAAAAHNRKIELDQKRFELLTRFTDDHPILKGLNRQRRDIDQEIAETTRRIKELPALEQDESRLLREIKVNTELYTALSNTAHQLRLISVGRVSNVRLIDAPMAPERPIKPNRPLIVALASVTGMFLGVLIAFARKTMSGGIDDPEHIERMLGARVVFASIPHSTQQERLVRKARATGGRLPLLALEQPEDAAVESLRSFRASLLFALPKFRNNVVMFTGPSHRLGKSFLSANFAAVMAASGKRVLLIDADLRNGQLHRYFGVERDQGLSRVLTTGGALDEIIHRDVIDNLDFIPTGPTPPNRAEFLQRLNLGSLLETVRHDYDIVLIDPPPLLAVADALVIGAHAGAVYILARAGVTTEVDINESIKRLNHAGISPQGLLFNDLPQRLGAPEYQFRYANTPRLANAT
ncbi:MAG: polysaccharide biosynthesis tyrosine autokinase [Gammaproteobacteria bacterium]